MWSSKLLSVPRIPSTYIPRWKHKSSQDQYIQRSKIPTYHFQKSLPRLPVPKLEATCDRYLAALEPLIDREQHNRTADVAKRFLNGPGKELQDALLKQDATNKHTSYISKLWFDLYLKERKALPINFNPMLVFHNDPKTDYNSPAIRASNMIISSLKFYKSLKEFVLEPEVFHLAPSKSDTKLFRTLCSMAPEMVSWYVAYLHNAYPLDMSQYSNLFNTTRLPRKGKDEIFYEPARHISIQHKGHFYVLEVLDEEGGIADPDRIYHSIKRILEEQVANPHPLGVFTTLDRDSWSSLREKLIELGNGESLKLIDTALFNVCLDDTVIDGDKCKLIRNFLHSDGRNRWFDKSVSLQFSKDGYAAVNFEHSWGDGVAVLRFFQDIFKDSTRNPQIHPDTAHRVPGDATVRKLEFKIDDGVKSAIAKTAADYEALCSSLDINIMESEELGKNLCKKLGVSPDAIVQLCFQAAYHKQFSKFAPTYESCSTAAFKHGRTEAIRPATMATKAFCLALHSVKSKPTNSELMKLMTECSKVHQKLTKEAAMGQGFDRHLLALKSIGETKGMTDLDMFNDASYAAINHNILSTSTLSAPELLGGGFGPVVRDGYGIGYFIRDDGLGTLATSYPGLDGREFIKCLERSMKEVVEVMLSCRV